MVAAGEGEAANVAPDLTTRRLKALLVGVVAMLTQCLPVTLIPEQRLVAAMGNYVINYSSRFQKAALPMHHTKRILSKEFLPCL